MSNGIIPYITNLGYLYKKTITDIIKPAAKCNKLSTVFICLLHYSILYKTILRSSLEQDTQYFAAIVAVNCPAITTVDLMLSVVFHGGDQYG